MALRTATMRAGKAATGAIAAGVASSAMNEEPAESFSLTVSQREEQDALLQQAKLLLLQQSKEQAHRIQEEMKEQGLIVSTHSEDGSEWLDVGNAHPSSVQHAHASEWDLNQDLERLLELASSVAAEPAVQLAVADKVNTLAWARESLELKSVSSEEADEERLSTSSSFDYVDDLLKQNELLRAENASLKSIFAKTNSRPAIALQALARGMITRRRLAAGQVPGAAPRVVTLRFFLNVSHEGARVGTSITAKVPTQLKPKKTQAEKELPRKVVIVTAAIIVGVLALVVARNPIAAQAAAKRAAATLFKLLKPKSMPRV